VRTIALARKPLIGSVADNVLRHEAGGLNIDASRVGRDPDDIPGWYKSGADGTKGYQGESTFRIHAMSAEEVQERCGSKGRWPPNVILQHRPECRQVGTKKVKGIRVDTRPEGDAGRADKSQWRFRPTEATRRGYSDENGLEEVPAWECHPECLIVVLDDQSGPREGCKPHHIKSNFKGYDGWGSITTRHGGMVGYDDEGGASRFYRQVQGAEMSKMPQEMIDYLLTMISPPEPAPRAMFLDLDSTDYDTGEWAKESVTGLLVKGEPTEKQIEEFLRVLRPGGHLMLVAPDDEPTGHTGACMIEDAGFEIRDSILWVDEPDGFHYVAKAARSEREAGCDHLAGKTGAEACFDRQEGSDGLECPAAGAGRTAERVKNFHPTVKALGLMRRLLEDVPTNEGPVLDPFMGSGTTALACVFTGHDFIGIEREEEYLEIADSRVRHWEREARGGIVGDSPEIVSDRTVEKPEMESLDSMFGWGDDD